MLIASFSNNFLVSELGIFVGGGDGGGDRDGVMSKRNYHIQGLQSFNLEM